MKLVAAVCALLVASGHAFVAPTSSFGVRSVACLHMARPDTTKYVEAAIEASKKYGPTSKEARVAWETVEEMDASDNSAAFTGGISQEECLVDNVEECISYHQKVSELATVLHKDWLEGDINKRKNRAKTLVEEIQAIRLTEPDFAAGADSPALRQALNSAKQASEKFGPDSTEARLAWETVEEIGAARNYENAMGGTLEDECLVEKIDACEGLDELKRVLNLSSS